LAAEDIAFAAQPEALREVLATVEGEPGGVGARVAGGAFKNAPSCLPCPRFKILALFFFLVNVPSPMPNILYTVSYI
jgi:hypothetical protein